MFSKFSKYLLIFLLSQCLDLTTCSNGNELRVLIDHEEFKGSIVGKRFNESNVNFVGFRGIPYAKPPINELRFRDPQKLDKFEGTLDATENGFECCSVTAFSGSEDCLNLNVYTKELRPSTLLPVVVLIHPGGLYLGSGSSYFMRPSHMMSQDLLLVTFNYRLGPLGFLNLGTPEIAGNAGFKDQVFALRWIQKNIKYFGGNPEDVTLMGYSAGALSVQLHLASAMGNNLFHKAIIMSGSLPPQTFLPEHQKYLAVRLAKRLNCPKFLLIPEEIPYGLTKTFSEYTDIKNEDILQCLNQFNGSVIGNKLRDMFDFPYDNPIFLWLPVLEKDFGQERFLSENLLVQNKNVLIGYTNGELCESAKYILLNDKVKSKFSKDFAIWAPRFFMYERHPHRDTISQKIKEKYFNNSTNFMAKDYDAICDLFSDGIIRFGAHKLAELLTQHKAKVYFYEFSFAEKHDNGFPEKEDRCEHMFDFQYLFDWPGRKHDTYKEKKMVEMYTSFMYDFVKNGKLSDKKAKPYPQTYALIHESVDYEMGRNFKNYEFWLDLFPKYFNYNFGFQQRPEIL